MNKKFHLILIKRKTLIWAVICFIACLGVLGIFVNLFMKNDLPALPNKSSNYVILGANDLGMHCYQTDYSGFLILPPGNTIKVQVFRNEGKEAKLINSGIEVSYQILDNTTSADKINFWKYATDYGYNVAPNIGITGNGLSGKMELSKDKTYYEATAIPVTPYNDGSKKLNPYQLAIIRVTDSKTGKELAKIDDLVVPVSDEMLCSTCHGTSKTDLNILKAHDELSKTQLVVNLEKGRRFKCSNCHQDNILDEPGKTGVLPLSQAMHGFHADKMEHSTITPKCYTCHPGPATKCYRGIMSASGIDCGSPECHGDMANIAKTQAEGRKAWLQEPDCGTCHGEKYRVNTGLLYKNSYLINDANAKMNGFILCISCHNSPHAEWKSTNKKDNLLPIRLLGEASYVNQCHVCHEGSGKTHGTMPNINEKKQGEK